jgi:hypothetical protein
VIGRVVETGAGAIESQPSVQMSTKSVRGIATRPLKGSFTNSSPTRQLPSST